MSRKKTSWKLNALLWLCILLALSVFGGACYGILRFITEWPVWAIIVISGVVAVFGFAVFVWIHNTNGFDGIYGDPPGTLLGGRQREAPENSRKKD